MAFIDQIQKNVGDMVFQNQVLPSLGEIKFQPPSWNQRNIAQAVPQGRIPFGNVIPFGPAPLSGTDLSDLLNQAVQMASKSVEPGGFRVAPGVPRAPEGMTAEQFLQFYDAFQQAQRDASQRAMMDYVRSKTEQAHSQAMASPLMAAATKAAQGMNPLDLFESMRAIEDVNYNRSAQNQAYDAARRGMAGSSTAQLASRGAAMQHGANLAGLWAQAQALAPQITSQQVASYLAPLQFQRSSSSDMANTLAKILMSSNPSLTFVG